MKHQSVKKYDELKKKEAMEKFGNSEFCDKPTNLYNLDMYCNEFLESELMVI